jgi:hypothetical protein
MADGPAPVGRERAEQAIAARFSRLMNATTSPFGVLADPALAGVPSAILFVAYLAAKSRDAAPELVRALGLLALVPLVLALLANLALLGARGRVVGWLAGLPFPLENVNGLLNGVGGELEVRFSAREGGAPRRATSSTPPSTRSAPTCSSRRSPTTSPSSSCGSASSTRRRTPRGRTTPATSASAPSAIASSSRSRARGRSRPCA